MPRPPLLIPSAVPLYLPHALSARPLHTSSPLQKKFKPQKMFLLPGQSPGQQRQERKRQEKIAQAVKRGRMPPPGQTGTRSSATTTGSDHSDRTTRMGSGESSVAFGLKRRSASWEDQDGGENDIGQYPEDESSARIRWSSEGRETFDDRRGARPLRSTPPLRWSEREGTRAMTRGRADDERPTERSGERFGLKPLSERDRASPRVMIQDSEPGRSSSSHVFEQPIRTSYPASRPDFRPAGSLSALHLDAIPGSEQEGASYDRRVTRPDAYSAVLRARGSTSRPSSASRPDGSQTQVRRRGYHSSAILRSALGDDVDWRVPLDSEYARYDRDKREARKAARMRREGEMRSGFERERPAGAVRRQPAEGGERRARQVSVQVDRPGVRQDDFTRPFRSPRRQPTDNHSVSNFAPRPTMTMTKTAQREALPEISPDEPRPEHRWAPTKRLSRPAMEGIKRLHAEDPIKHSRAVLSRSFGVSVEAIARILKSDGRWYKAEDDGEQEGLARRG